MQRAAQFEMDKDEDESKSLKEVPETDSWDRSSWSRMATESSLKSIEDDKAGVSGAPAQSQKRIPASVRLPKAEEYLTLQSEKLRFCRFGVDFEDLAGGGGHLGDFDEGLERMLGKVLGHCWRKFGRMLEDI